MTSFPLVLCVCVCVGICGLKIHSLSFITEMKFKDADCEDMYKIRIGSSGRLYWLQFKFFTFCESRKLVWRLVHRSEVLRTVFRSYMSSWMLTLCYLVNRLDPEMETAWETARFSEMLVLISQLTWCNISKNLRLQLKFYWLWKVM